MSDVSQKPRRSLWRRALRWLLALGILMVLFTTLTGWWASKNRVELTNRALSSLEGPVTAAVEAINIRRSGDFDIRGLSVKDKASGETVLKLPQASGTLTWKGLGSRSLTSLTLHQPEITLDEGMLARWREEAAGKAAGGSGSSAIFRLEKFEIRGAKLRFTQKDNTKTEVTVDYRSDFIAMSPEKGLSLGGQELTVVQDKAPSEQRALPYGLRRLHAKGSFGEGVLNLNEIALYQPSVQLTPELLGSFGIPATAMAASEPKTTSTSPAPKTDAPVLRQVRVEKLSISDLSVGTTGFKPGNAAGIELPDLQLKVPSYTTESLAWEAGGSFLIGSQTLLWKDIHIVTEDNDGHLHCEEAQLKLAPWKRDDTIQIEAVHLRNPDINWTSKLRQLLTQKVRGAAGSQPSPTAEPPATSNPTEKQQRPTIAIASGTISGAKVRISDASMMPFNLDLRGGLMLSDISFDEKGWRSKNFQTLEVTEGRLQFPSEAGQAEKKPWLELMRGELVIKPDDWNARRRVAKLNLEKLLVQMRDGNTPWVKPADEDEPAKEEKPKETKARTAEKELPWWKRLNFAQLSLKEANVDMVLNLPKPVDLRTRIDISTQRVEQEASEHKVRISNLVAKLPTLSSTPFPVAQAQSIEGRVRLPEMWSIRRFEELHVTGASVDMNEALLKLFEKDKQGAKSAPSPKTDALVLTGPAQPVIPSEPAHDANRQPPLPLPHEDEEAEVPWHVGHLSVQQSDITISNVLPGMPPVKFGVSFDLVDTPLLAEDLVDDVAEQRVELFNLKIPSPNGTARYVAELDSIVVTFTLEGLMRKEIDGVEIVSPTLFVGEDLFWYVEFYRNYAERGAQPAKQGPQIAANDNDLEFELAGAVVEAEPPISQASWSVKRLQVHKGKLVLAPKGVPLKGFRTPFPFKIDSEVTRGTLTADLEIPPDTYAIPELDLKFIGMHGRVQFNLPFKQKDNNLTETFEVESIRWKEIKTGKAFLSVTYDKAGIYATFGAEAYEGYINGQINVYNDEGFHWDGWLGGKNVETTDLTRILCPGYFIMDGRVEATLVAQGSKDELYQADGTFKNQTKGKFTIKALNGLIDDLPKDWDPLKAQITKIGLETLRDFEYDLAEMKCRFYGREGNGFLKFTGPLGSRNFDIRVFDHRWRTDDEPVQITTAGAND